MDISDFLGINQVALDVRVRDKQQLLNEIAQRCARAHPGLDASLVEAALSAREQLGSTGFGNGFALPHARIEGLDRYLGLFLRTSRPVAFNAIDDKPVQLVFALLIPPETTSHVSALAAISRRFRNADAVAKLSSAQTQDAAFNYLTEN